MDPDPASSALEAHVIAKTPVKATSRPRVFNIMMLSPVGIAGEVELQQSLRARDPLGCLPPRHSRAIVDYRSHPSRTKSVTLLHFAQVKDALSLSRRAGVPLSLMNKPSIFFSFVVVWIATAAVGQASAHPALVNSQATNCRSCHTEVFQQRPVLFANLRQTTAPPVTKRGSSNALGPSIELSCTHPLGRAPAHLSECGLSKRNMGRYPRQGFTFRRSTVACSGKRAGSLWPGT
jgi:hypothetical protein